MLKMATLTVIGKQEDMELALSAIAFQISQGTKSGDINNTTWTLEGEEM
jgi:hypothetical protein